MVTVTKTENETTFEIKGFHKLLAFKSELKIPNFHIVRAYYDEQEIEKTKTKTIRTLGTHIPGMVKAGNFYNYANSDALFMDISYWPNAIIVELKDEEYKKLIIEVTDPKEIITLLNTTVSSNIAHS